MQYLNVLLYQNIFLIDDDLEDQMFFIEALKEIENSLYCIVAKDGSDALDKLQSFLKLPDIIFLDINMPRMNGFEFLSQIKQHNKLLGIPIVILSTSEVEKNIIQKFSANAFIRKPSTFKLLRTKIEEVLKSDFIN